VEDRDCTVLVFTKERKVEQDRKGFGVLGQDEQLRDATIQRLGRFVGSSLELTSVCTRISVSDNYHSLGVQHTLTGLDEVQKLSLESCVGQRPGSR
jgi:hypothetical protein